MADVQKENGYTTIANELLEQIIKSDLTLREIKVMLCVIRYTYGFHRKDAQLSLRFIGQATGINYQNIKNSLKGLFAKNILTVKKEYTTGNTSRIISLNKNYDLWNVQSNQINYFAENESNQINYSKVIKPITLKVIKSITKKDIKDNIKKEDSLFELTPIGKETNEIKIFREWNQFASKNGLQTIFKLTDKRKKGIKQRLTEKEFNIETIFAKIAESNFMQGNNNRGWKVDFDFIFCSPDNYLKILEDKYMNWNGVSHQQPGVLNL